MAGNSFPNRNVTWDLAAEQSRSEFPAGNKPNRLRKQKTLDIVGTAARDLSVPCPRVPHLLELLAERI